MIGNNACGSRALGYGRTSDNVAGPRRRHRLGRPARPARRTRPRCRGRSTTSSASSARRGWPRSARSSAASAGRCRATGLEHLLPESGFDVARALVGSEGTLALVLGATVRLVADAAAPGPGRARLPLDGRRGRRDPGAAPPLPHRRRGAGLAHGAATARRARRRRPRPAPRRRVAHRRAPRRQRRGGDGKAARVLADAAALDSLVVTDAAEAAAIWRIREDGAGLAARTSDGAPRTPAGRTPPSRSRGSATTCASSRSCWTSHGLQCLPYGHFGDGCVHGRIDFPFGTVRTAARAQYRAFVEDAARLVAGYGGSLSGEHGDGRARSELLPMMYSPAVIALFEQVKAVFDPDDVLNPGVLVRPARVDDDVRTAAAPTLREGLALAYRHDGGDFSAAVHRCTGVGKCRADLQATGGVMCPSWPATREEKDTTRGRARVLQEMLAPGGPVRDWRSPEVHDALDLCLSCKGCSRDCPTGVDMATLQGGGAAPVLPPPAPPPVALHAGPAAVLGRPRREGAQAGQRRPHVAAGRPAREVGARAWTSGAPCRRSPGRPSGSSGPPAPGHDVRPDDRADGRAVGRLVHRPLRPRGRLRGRPGAGGGRLRGPGARRGHLLRADLDHHRPARSGPRDPGRDGARARAAGGGGRPDRRASSRRAPPRCAARRSRCRRTGGRAGRRRDPDARRAARRRRRAGQPPSPGRAWRSSRSRTATTRRCSAGRPTRALLERAGATVTRLGGCCGLAGNWGVERGHHEVSVTIAEQQLLPAVRAAGTTPSSSPTASPAAPS